MAASQHAVGDLLGSWSIGHNQFIIADGSGLSRYNYLTPAALVGVLEQVQSNRQSAAVFEATLPVAGRDGTLATRMNRTAAAGNARAKTGTMSNVRALAGFVDTQDGETLVFAILANNYQSGSREINRIIDRAIECLASFTR
jgi:D-alanyl-D-alanine carboxypeptidase/D-alanyl-D-alanine-endopeptidase (penicillin-binding protein 4)